MTMFVNTAGLCLTFHLHYIVQSECKCQEVIRLANKIQSRQLINITMWNRIVAGLWYSQKTSR